MAVKWVQKMVGYVAGLMGERRVSMLVGCTASRMEVRTTAKTVQSMAVDWVVLERAGVRAG